LDADDNRRDARPSPSMNRHLPKLHKAEKSAQEFDKVAFPQLAGRSSTSRPAVSQCALRASRSALHRRTIDLFRCDSPMNCDLDNRELQTLFCLRKGRSRFSRQPATLRARPDEVGLSSALRKECLTIGAVALLVPLALTRSFRCSRLRRSLRIEIVVRTVSCVASNPSTPNKIGQPLSVRE
jgi:hypothetical protein